MNWDKHIMKEDIKENEKLILKNLFFGVMWNGNQRKLFDYYLNKWSKNNSEFGSRLKGHKHVCVVIEDINGNILRG